MLIHTMHSQRTYSYFEWPLLVVVNPFFSEPEYFIRNFCTLLAIIFMKQFFETYLYFCNDSAFHTFSFLVRVFNLLIREHTLDKIGIKIQAS